MNPLTKLAEFIIRFYQLAISPYLPNTCRHQPTCSTYALIALKKHSLTKALTLTTKRLLHCHPLGTKGYDPVPD
jgi:putative membrane protein insertion efficiency factor